MSTLTYDSYLQTDTLLSLQVTQTPSTTDPAVILSEHFFIVTHQSCELWLKQVVADLSLVRDLLLPESGYQDDQLVSSAELLYRATELLRVLHDQVLVLERLPLRHFVEFRPYLGTASGAESEQFRALGRLVGGNKEPSELYQAFTTAVEQHGYSIAEVCRQGLNAGALHQIAETLVDLGNGYWRWKVAHVGLMSKMVGGQQGSGGTSGIDYLINRTTLPFPELRQLRGELHTTLTPSVG